MVYLVSSPGTVRIKSSVEFTWLDVDIRFVVATPLTTDVLYVWTHRCRAASRSSGRVVWLEMRNV